ncbi:MAG: ABC transporter ATP-binding protein [Methanoregula sp.]|nr:ABC transporter ATP-binding protein [Methanoregula sp.]
MNSSVRILAEKIQAGYSGGDVVKNVSCSFTAGTFTGIIGPNGSGKTTLLKAFSRVIPSSGILELDNKAVSAYSPAELSAALGFVPQDEGRAFPYSVLQVVLMARYARTRRFASIGSDDYARCHRALTVTGLARLANRSILTLSGGEWQRVLIARALAQDTGVLLLDEPTSHLDLSHQAAIFSLLRSLAAAGSTVIGVFHDLTMATLYCDRLVMICDGKIVADGRPEDVMTPEKIREVYGTEVVSSFHPVTGRMFLLPVDSGSPPGISGELQNVLVISGGGSGGELLHLLFRKGYRLSAGILATTDSDYLATKTLGIPCIAIPPFSTIPAPAQEKFRNSLARADRIVFSVHPVGWGNLPVLLALREVDPARIILHLPEGRDFASFDFARGSAVPVLSGLCAAGARCSSGFGEILEFLEKTKGKPEFRNEL